MCNGTLALLLALALLSPLALAQQRRTFTVPFDLHNGLILLKGELNGKPATFLLDTGSVKTMVSLDALGYGSIHARPVKPSKMGAGADGQYLKGRSDIGLGECTIVAQEIFAVDLSEVSKTLGTRIDGLLGVDVLRGFRQVRIDFKARTLELELHATIPKGE